MQNFESDLKGTKPGVVESYSNWSISHKPIDPILQEVKEIKDQKATALKMDFNSQYRLLLFLMRVV